MQWSCKREVIRKEKVQYLINQIVLPVSSHTDAKTLKSFLDKAFPARQWADSFVTRTTHKKRGRIEMKAALYEGVGRIRIVDIPDRRQDRERSLSR
jgi:hypothetical protein